MKPAEFAARTADKPTLYRPAEVAKMLRCSEWWIKEQARKRRIPFSWIGGSYLFTASHVAEIVQVFEKRPTDVAPVEPPPPSARKQRRAAPQESTVQLTARTPRRRQRSAAEPRAAG